MGGNECGAHFPLTGLGMMEPIGLLGEMNTASKYYRYSIIIIMDGKKDNHGVMINDQEKTPSNPPTRSQINLDSMFHSSFELTAAIVDHQEQEDRIITDVKFCDTKTGQELFGGISYEIGKSPLQTILQNLEYKHSRTDSALNWHKASRPDKFPDATKNGGYEEVYGRREHIIWSALARECESKKVNL